MLKYFCLFFLVGCSATTIDPNEKIEQYQRAEIACESAGGHMTVKRTGTRIRRTMTAHEVASAACTA